MWFDGTLGCRYLHVLLYHVYMFSRAPLGGVSPVFMFSLIGTCECIGFSRGLCITYPPLPDLNLPPPTQSNVAARPEVFIGAVVVAKHV